MSSNYCFNVTLHRDSLHTPWGFRLEGGRDFASPLTIQRVFQGSPATGYLQRGDIILSIQSRDTFYMYHQEANEVINRAGGTLQLTVKRGQAYPGSDGGYYVSHSYQTYRPHGTTQHIVYTTNQYSSVPSYGFEPQFNAPHDDDPSHYVRNRPIEKISDPKPILSQTGSPILPFSGNKNSSPRKYRPAKTAPIVTTNYSVKPVLPYQEKDMIDKLTTSLNRITVRPRPRPQSTVGYHTTYYTVQPEPEDYSHYGTVADKVATYQSHDQPPWQGTLKRANSVRSIAYPFSLNSAPKPKVITYTKQTTTTHSKPGQLKISNNQYNTPIGLYSRQAADEELNKQLEHKLGGSVFGDMPISDF